jgi:steroid 5-alpha reductase family enzyme
MMDQAFLLIILIIVGAATLYLYVYKAKKQVEYKNDERWQSIQNKTHQISSRYNDFLMLLLATVMIISLFVDITLSLDRALLFAFLAISFRNVVDLVTLKFFDTRL